MERRVAEVSVHGHVAGVWMGNIRGGAPRIGHVACWVELMSPFFLLLFFVQIDDFQVVLCY